LMWSLSSLQQKKQWATTYYLSSFFLHSYKDGTWHRCHPLCKIKGQRWHYVLLSSFFVAKQRDEKTITLECYRFFCSKRQKKKDNDTIIVIFSTTKKEKKRW
jgi:hypothetical protein